MLLELSDQFVRLQVGEEIRAEFGEYLPLDAPRYSLRKSIETDSLLRLLGEAQEWLLLASAAAFVSAYFATLGKRAADATWSSLSSVFRKKEVEPLAAVAKALSKGARKVDPEAAIRVCLVWPEELFEVDVRIPSTVPEEIALNLGVFVAQVPSIVSTIEAEMERSGVPLGYVVGAIQADASVILQWSTRRNPRCEVCVPSPREFKN